MQNPPSRYDVVGYPSYTHPQTHPDRLAVIGALFGLSPAPVTRCRVLELGCGNGSNLVPMACGLPQSQFLGIDLAAQPVTQGQRMIAELGLTNAKLIRGSLTELDEAYGPFDYLIAHGVFSWVPPDVREHILKLCQRLLTPHGIAFISYSALPGAHLRTMLREMLLFHVQQFEDPPERIRQAQALARFLADAQDTQDEYRLWMKAELDSILGHEEGHLYHDELADISEPVYFTQFAAKAAAHGLKFLGEADYFEMFDHGFKPVTRDTLKQLSRNRILREQYLDFLKCRRFRQTLLCRDEAPAALEPNAACVAGFWVASSARPTDGETDLGPGKTITYATPKGAKCATDFPLGKAALGVLCANESMPAPFSQVFDLAAVKLANAGIPLPAGQRHQDGLASFLLELYGAGVVEFRSWTPQVVRQPSHQPAVSELTRWQVQHGDFVTSQFHIAVKIEDEIGRLLLASLDGTSNHAALLDRIWGLLKSKDAVRVPEADEGAIRSKVEMDLKNNLEKLARLGLLVS